MIQRLHITVLVENTAGARGLLAEHGLAMWVQADGTNILFDTGQGMALTANAKALGIDLGSVNAVVLSHGHYDHTGGLEQVLALLGNATVYIHPRAFEAKYARQSDGTACDAGCPIPSIEQISPPAARVITTTGPTKVADGIWVTGEIPRKNDFEDTGGPFFLDQACRQADPLMDDQALCLETAKGLVVLTGCGHSGLVNTLDYVSKLAGVERIHSVLGGFHLVRASAERMTRTVEALQRYDVQHIGPAHCTGLSATARILGVFPERFVNLAAGSEVIVV
ncbi:MAG: MBL fold metallo-hydrolase [Phycisphaerae bacterium]|nr:MBL fold metallo-hydrolase [Phycisphaerae bacterium]